MTKVRKIRTHDQQSLNIPILLQRMKLEYDNYKRVYFSLIINDAIICYKVLTRTQLEINTNPFNGIYIARNVIIDEVKDEDDALRPRK